MKDRYVEWYGNHIRDSTLTKAGAIDRRVSSQRGRITEVQVREPIRQEGYPMPQLEDKHKFIHDGKEYDRAPNLFDVGGGKLKLLPEVFSNLGFESHDFVDDGTLEEQRELRDSRFWGRLYIYGWPAPIQYLRSHFGGPAVEGMRPLVLADPPDACEPLRSVDLTGARMCCVHISTVRSKCFITWSVFVNAVVQTRVPFPEKTIQCTYLFSAGNTNSRKYRIHAAHSIKYW